MKVRDGFVSNSSSSSFLIIEKNKSMDLERFKAFKGYDIFVNDLKNAKMFDQKVKKFISKKIEIYFYHFYQKIEGGNDQNVFDLGFELAKIFDDVKIDVFGDNSPFNKIYDTFNEYKSEFWKKLEEASVDLFNFVKPLTYATNIDIDEIVRLECDDQNSADMKLWTESLKEYHDKCGKFYFSDEFKKIVDDTVNDLFAKMISENVSLKVLTYADDTPEGSMMEHNFMPFVMNDPEEKINIISNCNH